MALFIKAQTKQKLEEELAYLNTEGLQKVNREIKEAREFGDLSENYEYHAAREAKGKMEERIAELSAELPNAIVYEHKDSYDKVEVGSIVTLLDIDTDEKKTVEIVGKYDFVIDCNPPQITNGSPLGKTLLGLEQGDEVDFEHNGKTITYEVLEIK